MAQLALSLDAAPLLALDPLDPDERAVARALRWGHEHARQVPEIAALAQLSGRHTQEIVQRLLLVHYWPIGTSMSRPFGNYLIASPDELTATVELLRSRGISHLARAAALRRMTLRRYLALVQTELRLESGP